MKYSPNTYVWIFKLMLRTKRTIIVGLFGFLLFGIIASCVYINSLSPPYVLRTRMEGQIESHLTEWKMSSTARMPVLIFHNMSNSQYIWSNIKHFANKTLTSILSVYKRKDVMPNKSNVVKDIQITSKVEQTNLILKNKTTSAASAMTTTTTTTYRTTTPVCVHPELSRFICEGTGGRLGNEMFSYASGYGIAMHGNRTMVIEKSRSLNNYFTLDATLVDKCFFREVKHKTAKKHCAFDKDLFNLKQSENYYVGTYLQSWKYFENVVQQIKKQFKFKSKIFKKSLDIINKILDEYLKNNSGVNVKNSSINITFVGIHVRHGDINSQKRFVNYGYLLAPKEYIHNAMEYFTRNFTNVLFVICSDSMTWVEANIKHKNIFYVKGNSPEVDMSVLVNCNHTITTVGTFGWWAGFLTGGITLYYKYPARAGSGFRKAFSEDYSDFFYPGWIGME